MPRVSFTGTRRGLTTPQVVSMRLVLRALYSLDEPGEWHDGDCVGADAQAHALIENHNEAAKNRVVTYGHPSNMQSMWARNIFDVSYQPKPPLDRNHDMVDATEILVACPGEETEVFRSGTWATIRYARKQVPTRAFAIIYVWPDGHVTREGPGRV